MGKLAALRKSLDGYKTRRAFHGTPHDFDEFSLKHIGTGEGAQAYGHGLYFSSSEDIAKYYRNVLSDRKLIVDGQEFVDNGRKGGGIVTNYLLGNLSKDDAIKRLRRGHRITGEAFEDVDSTIKAIEADNFNLNSAGRLFEVEIPDESHMLDWDQPISWQQAADIENELLLGYDIRPVKTDRGYGLTLVGKDGSGKVIDFVGYGGNTAEEAENAISRALTGLRGNEVYRELSRLLGGDDAASKALRDAGFPGLTYIGDSSSERNFVLFDDSLIDVKQKGNVDPRLLGAVGMGGAAAEFTRRRAEKSLNDPFRAIGALGSGFVGEILGLGAKAATVVNPWSDPDAAERAIEGFQERIQYDPGPNATLEAIGAEIQRLGENPAAQQMQQDLGPYWIEAKRLYDSLPARARMALDVIGEAAL